MYQSNQRPLNIFFGLSASTKESAFYVSLAGVTMDVRRCAGDMYAQGYSGQRIP